jgi:hypothetical protein
VGDVPVTHVQALGLAAVGVATATVGLVLLFGPWALVGSGLVLVALALLIPEERRDEPADEVASPGTGSNPVHGH